jgi:hypothetical protein
MVFLPETCTAKFIDIVVVGSCTIFALVFCVHGDNLIDFVESAFLTDHVQELPVFVHGSPYPVFKAVVLYFLLYALHRLFSCGLFAELQQSHLEGQSLLFAFGDLGGLCEEVLSGVHLAVEVFDLGEGLPIFCGLFVAL